MTNDAGEDKRTVDLTVQGRTGLLYGLILTIIIHFIIPLPYNRASFSTYLTFTFSVGKERCMIRVWKSGRVANVYFLLVVIVVLVPPSIADEPTDFLVTKHAPTVITCTASGVPFPSIHWTKNGIRLLPRGDGYRILSSGKAKLSDYTSMIRLIMNRWLHLAFFWYPNKRIKYIFIPRLRHLGGKAVRVGRGIREQERKKIWKQNNNN